jgi:hypothetical protein
MAWSLPELTIDEATTLLKTEFGQELLKVAAQHIVYLTFGVVDTEGLCENKEWNVFFY